jgi:hypothetical protein
LGIFGRIRERLSRSKKAPEAERETNSAASEPMPPSPPPQTGDSPAEKTAGNLQEEDLGPKAPKSENEPEEGIRLPVKRHVLREIEDPFSKKDQSRIFQENLDLIDLFKKGEFSESEALDRQRSAIIARLKRKRIDPNRAKGVIDDYAFYFRKELEETERRRAENEKSGKENDGVA